MKTSSQVYDVIIIGAGLAGLSAARHCQAAGLKVIILEANDRTGGRVWTRKDAKSGIAVDWGAEWIIPKMHHEVMALVKDAALILDFTASQPNSAMEAARPVALWEL